MARCAEVSRKTYETEVMVKLDLDGTGTSEVATGIGFLDHMLSLLAKHGLMNLSVRATGDLHVDAHHTVEDVGIALGSAIAQALGDKRGIARYGSAVVPMDEALVMCAADLGGRPYLSFSLELPSQTLGTMDSELVEEFFRAVANNAGMNIHLVQMAGRNTHHIVEAAFKAFGRALDAAVQIDPRVADVPSTKGVL
ncbi:MAG: imidazoleglycerol-phosphate dehydratase HisB [Armatimonadota bacterium]